MNAATHYSAVSSGQVGYILEAMVVKMMKEVREIDSKATLISGVSHVFISQPSYHQISLYAGGKRVGEDLLAKRIKQVINNLIAKEYLCCDNVTGVLTYMP